VRVAPLPRTFIVFPWTAMLLESASRAAPFGSWMPHMEPTAILLLLCAAAAGCSGPSETTADGRPADVPVADLPDIDAGRMLAHIRTLSSDAFRGRKPGTEGEDLTVAYLEQQFQQLGLQPGNTDGTYVQQVRLVGL